jgi:nucleoside phosphorylase
MPPFFIGRKAELAQFGELIARQDTFRLLNMHGPGGIGKTALGREMLRLATAQQLPAAMVTLERDERTAIDVMNQISEGLRASSDGFAAYQRMAADAQSGQPPTDLIGSFMRDLAQFNHANRKPSIIVMDGYDDDVPDSWLVDHFLPHLPDTVRVVVLGRAALPDHDEQHAFAATTRTLPLSELPKDDAQNWLRQHGLQNARALNRAYEYVGGYPLLLMLAVHLQREAGGWDRLGVLQYEPDRDAMAQQLLDRIVREERDSELRALLEKAASLPMITPDAISTILAIQPNAAQGVYTRLEKHPFFEQRRGGLKLQGKIQDLLRGSIQTAPPMEQKMPLPAPIPPKPAPPVILVGDDLDYRLEDQPWYVHDLPDPEEISEFEGRARRDDVEVLIMTATPVELNAVLARLQPYPGTDRTLKTFVEAETYYLGKMGEYVTAVTRCQMGTTEAGSSTLATDRACRLWHPKVVIMVGIAFGRDPQKQNMADVLVATQIISYEPQRVGKDGIIYRGSIPPVNPTLLNRFQNALEWRFVRPDGARVNAHYGPILSGEGLIDSAGHKAQLFRQFPQAIGGEMEGTGLFAAAIRNGVPCILVKAICDWADGNKHGKHQPLAAAAAVSLVQHTLSQKHALDAFRKIEP